MKFHSLFFAFALLAVPYGANAGLKDYDMGGYITDPPNAVLCQHMNVTCADYYNRSHQSFIVGGTYASAVTMALLIKNVCVTPDSAWGFHTCFDVPKSSGGWLALALFGSMSLHPNRAYSEQMRVHYPKRVRDYLDSVHALERADLTWLTGKQLIELGVRQYAAN